jgi:hypothetical protein
MEDVSKYKGDNLVIFNTKLHIIYYPVHNIEDIIHGPFQIGKLILAASCTLPYPRMVYIYLLVYVNYTGAYCI